MQLDTILKQLQGKMSRDIGWTLGSFLILAASGIVINIVIAFFRDAQSLGVFNQAYSFYIIVSQIAVFGIQYSVLRNAALYKDDPDQLGPMLISAIVPSLILGIFYAVLVYLAAPLISDVFESELTGRATAIAALGLALFPLNKVLISFVNGLREMKAFALLQSCRYLIVAGVVCYFAMSDLPFEYSTICFFLAESITVLSALFFILSRKLAKHPHLQLKWIKEHIRFGAKGLLAGMFVEINTRVDVLMLGYFMSDRAVGIYSFAAMLFDGLYHLLAMIRINFNPVLVTSLRDGLKEDLVELFQRTRLFAPLVMGVLSAAIILAYWIATTIIIPGKGLDEGIVCLIILLTGLTLLSGYIPFDNLPLVGGHPGYQTIQQMLAVLANIAGNLAFIPLFGIEGAAMGTTLSYVAGMTTLVVMSKRLFHWDLIVNRIEK